jgi:hypothetical protein
MDDCPAMTVTPGRGNNNVAEQHQPSPTVVATLV